MAMRTWGLVSVAIVSSFGACHRRDEPAHVVAAAADPPASVPSQLPAPRGPLRSSVAMVGFCVYHLSAQKQSPLALARALAKKAGFEPVDDPPKSAPTRRLVTVKSLPIAEMHPPDLRTLEFRGRDLSPDERQRLQKAQSFTAVAFMSPGADALPAYRAALGVMRELAQLSDGFVEDEEQRQVMSPAAVGKKLDAWNADVPDVRRHVSLDMYRDEELMRIVSLGMAKLGLPDVSVANVAVNDSEAMGNLVSIALQTMVENPTLARAGELDLSIAKLHLEGLRKAMRASQKPKGTGAATVYLAIAEPQKGDAENRQFEIVFPGPSATLQVRQNELLSRFFGSEEKVLGAHADDDELNAARARALRALAKLKPRFTLRQPALEHLLVKAPFTTRTSGVEWMWVEVVRWEGKKLSGILQNDPYEVDDLKAGAHVEVNEDALFDYLYRRADGTDEGGETTKILMAREKRGQ
jgi:uncharacterized protein YegJ (DUF2314 family)